VIVAAGVITTLCVVPLFRIVGKNFIPTDDQSEFEVIVQMPGGYTLAETDRVLRELEQKVRALRCGTNILTTIGDTTGNIKPGQGDVTIGNIYVRLVDLSERDHTQFEVMADARQLFEGYPDLRVSVQGVSSFSGGGTRKTDLEFNLRGPSFTILRDYSDKIMARMRSLPGVVDADTTLSVRQPEPRAVIDRKKASEFAIQIADVAATLQTFVVGEPISKFKEESDEYNIWLRAVEDKRKDPQAILNLTVPGRDGQLVKSPISPRSARTSARRKSTATTASAKSRWARICCRHCRWVRQWSRFRASLENSICRQPIPPISPAAPRCWRKPCAVSPSRSP